MYKEHCVKDSEFLDFSEQHLIAHNLNNTTFLQWKFTINLQHHVCVCVEKICYEEVHTWEVKVQLIAANTM